MFIHSNIVFIYSIFIDLFCLPAIVDGNGCGGHRELCIVVQAQ